MFELQRRGKIQKIFSCYFAILLSIVFRFYFLCNKQHTIEDFTRAVSNILATIDTILKITSFYAYESWLEKVRIKLNIYKFNNTVKFGSYYLIFFVNAAYVASLCAFIIPSWYGLYVEVEGKRNFPDQTELFRENSFGGETLNLIHLFLVFSST